jgi:hypothetical protein
LLEMFPTLRQIWRKVRGWILSAFSLLPLSDTLEYVSMYVMSVFLDRSDGAIFDTSLVTQSH